jgi:hypothetical protein
MKNYILLLLLISCSHTSGKKVVTKPQHYRGDTDFHPKAKNPAFTETHPKVCFDEGHNNLAVEHGFYKPILELLTSDGYEVVHKKERFTEQALHECSILYVSAVLGHADYQNKKLSTQSAFNEKEIKSITTWVENGGSLMVMTDHRPMANAASKLLEEFEVQGSIINVRNENNKIPPFTEDGIFFIPESQMNLKSPIVKGRNESERLKKIFFFYGEALQGPKESDIFLLTGPAAKIGGTEDDNMIPSAKFPAAALALKVKKGRLVVFGDGTVFTSKMDLELNEKTGINREGSDNIQMALNVFHWLSGIL